MKNLFHYKTISRHELCSVIFISLLANYLVQHNFDLCERINLVELVKLASLTFAAIWYWRLVNKLKGQWEHVRKNHPTSFLLEYDNFIDDELVALSIRLLFSVTLVGLFLYAEAIFSGIMFDSITPFCS